MRPRPGLPPAACLETPAWPSRTYLLPPVAAFAGVCLQMGPDPPGGSAPQPGVPACAAQRHTTLRDP